MQTQTTLITVLGSSPQVMTETLFALKDKNFPQRIIIFTTKHGAQRLIDLKVQDKIDALCLEYRLPALTLTQKDIIVVQDILGNQLEDIRNIEDQESMADRITSVVRDLVKDENTAIHASIAGGRKSMSFYMGYIFSIFARPFDSLSHVLVSPEFESNNFWFPTKDSAKFVARIDYKTGEELILDAKDAMVELAEIPFIRLNKALTSHGDMLTMNASYRETLAAYQLALNPELIKLVFAKDKVLLNGVELKMPIDSFAFYKMVAISCHNELCYSTREEDVFSGADDLLLTLSGISNLALKGESPLDMADEILDNLQFNLNFKVNRKSCKTLEDKGLTKALIGRMNTDITNALKKVAIGKTIDLCAATTVKDEIDETNVQARTQTNRNGFCGICLNPKQITIL